MRRKVSGREMIPGRDYYISGYRFTYLGPISTTRGQFRYTGGDGLFPPGYESDFGMFNWEEAEPPSNNISASSLLDKEW